MVMGFLDQPFSNSQFPISNLNPLTSLSKGKFTKRQARRRRLLLHPAADFCFMQQTLFPF
jgi:hypothetical protein